MMINSGAGGARYTRNRERAVPGWTELVIDEYMEPSWSGLHQGNTEDACNALLNFKGKLFLRSLVDKAYDASIQVCAIVVSHFF